MTDASSADLESDDVGVGRSQRLSLLTAEVGHARVKFGIVDKAGSALTVRNRLNILPASEFAGPGSFERFLFQLSDECPNATTIDGIAISVSGPVDHEEGSCAPWAGFEEWPTSLSVIASRIGNTLSTPARVVIVNDAVAFSLAVWQAQRNRRSAPPVTLCMTLGWGIGCALVREGHSPRPLETLIVEPIELHGLVREWPDGFRGDPHELAGEAFFEWALAATTWNVRDVQREFTQRVNEIIRMLLQHCDADAVVVGGGRSADLDLSRLLPTVSRAGPGVNGNVGAAVAHIYASEVGPLSRCVAAPWWPS